MRLPLRHIIGARPYLGSLAAVIAALLTAVLFHSTLGVNSAPRIFLVAVLITAIAHGLWPALFASLISALAYDYFLLPPVYSLGIATNEGIVDFCFFVVAAIIVSSLAARVRRHVIAADARALSAELLSAFIQGLAASVTVRDVMNQAAERMSAALGMPVTLIVMEDDLPFVTATFPNEVVPADDCIRNAVAWWALRPQEDSRQAITLGDWRFQALRGDGEPVGLIATAPKRGGIPASGTRAILLDTLAHQTGLAIERRILRGRLERSRMAAEAAQFRSTVLTSISHDLRNPLASIAASASVLESQWDTIDDVSKLLMARTIRRESERLDGFVGKLIDMTRIESDMVKPQCRPVSIPDVAETVVHRLSDEFVSHRITIDIQDDLQLANADAILLEQVLLNLVENAAKYAPPATSIRIIARDQEQSVCITVLDEGPGLAQDDLEKIFDNFYRAPAAERLASGTGLGLAICRGFVESMGGKITATNRDDRRGAAFSVILPAATHRELHGIEPCTC